MKQASASPRIIVPVIHAWDGKFTPSFSPIIRFFLFSKKVHLISPGFLANSQKGSFHSQPKGIVIPASFRGTTIPFATSNLKL